MNKVRIIDFAKVTNGKADVKDAVENGVYYFFDRSTIVKKSNSYIFDTSAIIIPGEDSRQIFEPRYFIGKFNLHQRCYVIYDFDINVNSKYIYYKIKTLTKHFANVNVGSTVPSLRLDHITDLEITLPSFPTQQKIASVLSSLDDKIELNNRINAELEAMAKTLYDYWFVQFDFPVVTSSGVEKSYKSSGGKMVYNETLKREIPVGWEVTVFNDWIKNTKAGDWGKETIEGNYTERVYCIRGADINGINGKGEVKAPERFILKNNSSKKLMSNDFVVEISGGSPVQSTGRIALITESTLERFDTDIICSNFCKAVSIKNEKYIYNFKQEWQRLYDAGVFFGFEGKTSGIKNFLFDSFMNSYSIVLPKKEIAEKYYEFAQSIDKKIQSNLKQNQELSALRDWLLPMLMNGQVKVGEIEENKN